MRRVGLFVSGRRVEVPPGTTVLAAIEMALGGPTRLSGCLDGSCGACLTSMSAPGREGIRTVLACREEAREDMWIGVTPPDRKPPARYDFSALTPDRESLVGVYPEMASCTACGACAAPCPQELDVPGYMAAMLSGDLPRATELSLECTMCTACSVACPQHLDPYRYAVLARRLAARSRPVPDDVLERAAAVRAGAFAGETEELSRLSDEELAGRAAAARPAAAR